MAAGERLALTLAEAAELVGVSERHMQNLAAKGVIPTTRLGSRRVVPVDEFRRWLNDNAQGGSNGRVTT